MFSGLRTRHCAEIDTLSGFTRRGITVEALSEFCTGDCISVLAITCSTTRSRVDGRGCRSCIEAGDAPIIFSLEFKGVVDEEACNSGFPEVKDEVDAGSPECFSEITGGLLAPDSSLISSGK